MSTVRDTPQLVYEAGDTWSLKLSVTPRTGLTLDQYGTPTLTIWEDPLWPRSGPDRAARSSVNPVADGWTVAVTADGTIDAVNNVISFSVPLPADAGDNRYVVAVRCSGGSLPGPATVFDPTWLSMRAPGGA